MPNWTEQQQEAITQEGNVLVSASAGSGKTAVLTERVSSLIESGRANADELLVVTFTKDAAGEMRDRIAANLEKRLEDEKKSHGLTKKARRLQEQLRQIHQASIETMHAFCNQVIRKHYYRVGTSPTTRLVPELMATILKDRAIESVLKSEIAAQSLNEDGAGPVFRFIDYFGGIENTKKQVQIFADTVRGYTDWEGWMTRARMQYDDGMERQIDACIRENWKEVLERAEKLEETIENDPDMDMDMGRRVPNVRLIFHAAGELREMMRSKKAPQSELDALRLPDRIEHGRYPDEIRTQLKTLRDDLDLLRRSRALKEEQIRRMKQMAPFVHTLIDITERYMREYQTAKSKSGYIDYADMEHYALQILQDEEIAREYRERYRYVFVDEYQDTNPVQEKLVSLVTRGDNLYCVGDMKQSIYRFRSADPTLFSGRARKYADGAEAGRVIPLTTNFRSAKNILDCANDVFAVLAGQSDEITYGEADALQLGREDRGDEPDVCVKLINPEGAGNQWILKQDEPLSSCELESLETVRQIQEQIGKDIYVPAEKTVRPCRYGDIAVLARKRTGFREELMKVMKNNGIPFVLDKSGKLCDAEEIKLLASILTLNMSKANDIAVMALCHNRFFGLNDEDMLKIRLLTDQKEMLMQGVRRAADGNDDLAVKCRMVVMFTDQLDEKVPVMRLSDVIRWAVDELEFRDFCACMGDSRQRLANLDEFIRRADEVQTCGRKRLRDFLDALRLDEKATDRIASARVAEEGDCVRLVTIHGSKGLQYPVVIMPFLEEDVSYFTAPTLFCDEKSGLFVRYRDLEKDIDGGSLLRQAAAKEQKKRTVEEAMRLLYVGMTRAEQKLVLIGSAVDTFNDTGHFRKLPEHSFMSWILNDVLHAVGDSMGNWRILSALQGRWNVEEIQEDVLQYRVRPAYSSNAAADADAYDIRMKLEEMKKTGREFEEVPLYVTASHSERIEDMFSLDEEEEDAGAWDVQAVHKGTAFHLVMQMMDFTRVQEPGYLEELSRQYLSKEQQEAFSADSARRLMQGPVLNGILRAEQLVRERRVQTSVPYSAVQPGYTGKKKTTLVCVVDLLFQCAGKWYLLDYKTDRFFRKPGEAGFEAELKEKSSRHTQQMALYEMALKDCCGIEVEDTVLGYAGAGVFWSVKDNRIIR